MELLFCSKVKAENETTDVTYKLGDLGISGVDICAIIPTSGKRQKDLHRAIESVLHQTEKCGEVIVVWDSTSELPNQEFYGDQIKFIRNQTGKKGVAAARNSGILESKCKYIALLDDDDYWLPQKIEMYVSTVNAYGSDGFYVSRATYIDEDESIIGIFPSKKLKKDCRLADYLFNNILLRRRRAAIPTSSYMFPRIGKNGINLFDEEIFLAEDILLLLRIDLYLPFRIVGDDALSVTKIYRNLNEGLSRRPISFVDWISIQDKHFSFLAPRNSQNIRLFYGIHYYRDSYDFISSVKWLLGEPRKKADFITKSSSVVWLLVDGLLRSHKYIFK